MKQKILVVDDEFQIVRVVQGYLQKADFIVLTANNGQEALAIAREHQPDLVILDVRMPVMDGLEFTRRIRVEQPDIAIIMLTSQVEEMDRVLGLEMGADDYVPKPFSPRELVARVRALLRRAQRTAARSEVLTSGDLILDIDRREVQKQGQMIELTPMEFELLATMMRAPGRAFARADLLESIQGIAFEAYERTVDVHIKNLRRKIEDDPAKPAYIGTVRGVGYRLIDR